MTFLQYFQKAYFKVIVGNASIKRRIEGLKYKDNILIQFV